MISTRASKRRIATRFAVAGALAAAPIAVVAGTAQAAPASTHHEQFGRLVPLPEPADAAPGPGTGTAPLGRDVFGHLARVKVTAADWLPYRRRTLRSWRDRTRDRQTCPGPPWTRDESLATS